MAFDDDKEELIEYGRTSYKSVKRRIEYREQELKIADNNNFLIMKLI